jgi:DNA repair protein RecN (Recombination protein N)
MQELLDSGYYALQELARSADAYAAGVDLDPSRLEQVRQRRELLYGLLKKYGPTIDKVIATGGTARAELDTIDSAGFDLAALEARRRVAESALASEAGRLSDLRASAAKKLAKAVVPLLKELGMPAAKFSAALIPRDTIAPDGAEAVEFRVALNVGHEERALSRVASGGELSRVMLALKTILAKLDAVPTLIFDEVDAGIGGKVGLQVGDTLRRVARDHQVFVISHLPQIAARAQHHIVVAKGAKGGVTTADITVLGGTDRVAEIARMLGGDPESKVSRAHARELLDNSETAD